MNIDPNKIFERGFITEDESEKVGLVGLKVKVNLIDDDGDIEGIWLALLTDEDKALYDGGSRGDKIKGVLLNHALCFLPNPTWGRVIVGQTNGNHGRPIFKRIDQVVRMKETHEAYLAEYPIEEGDV